MPQRIIAPGGGNWSSTSTWVGGVVPTSSDYVTGDATSGSLTLDVNTTIQYFDMSAYTATFTLNATRQLNVNLAGSTSIFNPLMSWAGTGELAFQNNNSLSGTSSTSRIPQVYFQSGVRTLSSNIYVVNFRAGNSTCNANKLFVSGNISSISVGINGTTTFELDGTGSWLSTSGTNGIWGSNPVVINTTGTITIVDYIRLYAGPANPTCTISYTNGTVVNPRILFATDASSGNLNAELGTTYDWDLAVTYFGTTASAVQTATITTNNNISYNNVLLVGTRSDFRDNDYVFAGTATNIDMNSLTAQIGRGAQVTGYQAEIRLSTTPNFNIDKLFIYGTTFQDVLLKSVTNGVQAKLNLGDNKNSPLIYVDVQDINNLGQTLKTWNGTVSNSTNVTSYTTDIFPTSTGGGTSASASIN